MIALSVAGWLSLCVGALALVGIILGGWAVRKSKSLEAAQSARDSWKSIADSRAIRIEELREKLEHHWDHDPREENDL